jgi:hypothetical protein
MQQARASDGAIAVPTSHLIVSGLNGLGDECLSPFSNGFEVIFEVTPDPAQAPSLSVPGLSLGGQNLWKYTYRFKGVMLLQGIKWQFP